MIPFTHSRRREGMQWPSAWIALPRRRASRERIRLHRRRRRLRGLRAGRPADRRRTPPRAAARSGRHRQPFLGAGAHRLRQVLLRAARQLDVPHGIRGCARRTVGLLAARQAPRRLGRDQRDGVRARPTRGLRRVGGARQSRLGLARRAPVLPEARGQPARRDGVARCRRTGHHRRHSCRGAPAVRSVPARRHRSRDPAQRRLQRRNPGRRRLLRDHGS